MTEESKKEPNYEAKNLVHRLSRAQGQLEAIKRRLILGESPDCRETIQQLKAANRAITQFAEAYVTHYFEECIAETKMDSKVEKKLKEAIAAAFTM